MCKSVVLSIFTLLCNSYPGCFHLNQTWYSLISPSPFLPSLQPLAATILLSVSMILTLDSSCIGLAEKLIQVFPQDCMEKPKQTSWPTNKWTNTIFISLRQVYFISIMSSRLIHVVVCIGISFPFKIEYVPLCAYSRCC